MSRRSKAQDKLEALRVMRRSANKQQIKKIDKKIHGIRKSIAKSKISLMPARVTDNVTATTPKPKPYIHDGKTLPSATQALV